MASLHEPRRLQINLKGLRREALNRDQARDKGIVATVAESLRELGSEDHCSGGC